MDTNGHKYGFWRVAVVPSGIGSGKAREDATVDKTADKQDFMDGKPIWKSGHPGFHLEIEQWILDIRY